MSDLHPPHETDPIEIPHKQTCADVLRATNEQLRRRCSGRRNLLSCRCSLCPDDRLPVLLSQADAALLNTAYDGKGGALTSGADSYWEVGSGKPTGGPGTVSAWGPAQVVSSPNPAWVKSPFSNAGWISTKGVTGNDLYFRIRFNLGSTVDPAAFVLAMDFSADNRVMEIWVNNTPQSTQPNGAGKLPGVSPSQYKDGGQVRIRLDNHWQPCGNTIVVHVESAEDPVGLLVQNSAEVTHGEGGCDCRCQCRPVEFPAIKPCITVAWGDSPCDCMETDDVEVLCITVCNCYSNVAFHDLVIGRIQVTDLAGNPVPTLPDGTPSVQVVPSGPVCFGDVGPCVERDRPTCVSREVVLYTRGAVGKAYRLSFGGICFTVCHPYQDEQCFTFKLCQD
ncbi:hypothetical protein [Longimicrobium sp.]|uniref:hypothetical protein n=1 Tax=Longimicrobium sp. TaxID=2029185 RepID=UPI002C5F9E11|nr:hypothetical protein [Longimicrobium sp.]HSU17159.1 hypothetical protein [Longimicrobium sp.]